MKLILTLMLAGTLTATAGSTNVTVNAAIPDNDPNGFASSVMIDGLSASVGSVTVSLDITGGFNGDLYAYLLGPGGGLTVLLNRTGVGGGSANGYNDAGFNVTLSDAAAGNIHSYQNLDNPAGGQLTGTWQPDGRNIDPQSGPAAFDAATASTPFSNYFGTDGNGKWSLFVADLSGGDQSTLLDWGLYIAVVPEPEPWMLLSGGMLLLFGFNYWRSKR